MLNSFILGLGSPAYTSWILISALFLVGFGNPPYTSTTMRVQFTNIQAAQGSIYLAVYDQADKFLDEQEMRFQKIIPVSALGSLDITLPDLPAGDYAISCFHDVNGNGKMDKNFVGVPTEPYGFSNNARPTFRAPNWEEARFYWQPGADVVRVRLEKW